MNFADEILETIQYGIDKALASYKNQELVGIFRGIENNKYKVLINGREYFVFNGVGINLNINDSVWVHVPNGNMRKAYICARANANA